jgi:hypothetical protein
MNLFLAVAQIEQTEYMQDGAKLIQDMRIVQAADEDEAQFKYEQFWERKCESYSVSYCIVSLKLTPTLV